MNTMAHVVEAAGGIIYRWRSDSDTQGVATYASDSALPGGNSAIVSDDLEVCVVHRPKYDDWSWPKGKLEPNESHRHAAVREIEEETGFPVALGARLGEIEYPLDQEGQHSHQGRGRNVGTKHVAYWMAHIISPEQVHQRSGAFGPVRKADRGEIDTALWMTVKQARHKLTHSLDRDILDLFVDRIEEGALSSTTFLIVRHGKAESRKLWRGDETNRPITPRGASAAYALNRELACYNPTRLVTSPWIRCKETLQVFSWQTGLPMVNAQELTEDDFAADPQASWHFVQSQILCSLERHQALALCTHRPVIGGIFEQLRTMCISKQLAGQLTAVSPYMPTGTAVAVTVVAATEEPQIIDVQRVSPIVY